MEFGEFLKRFFGRYARLTRIEVVGKTLALPVIGTVGLGLLLVGELLPHSPFQEAVIKVGAWPNDVRMHVNLAREAAKIYDYKLAEAEVSQDQRVLGVSSDTNALRQELFPEEKIKAEIDQLEIIRSKVASRDVLLRLALLYWQIFDEDRAKDYFEKARILDPNNAIIQEVGKLL